MSKISTVAEMELAAGPACLNFVNTALNEDLPVERLHDYEDLLTLSVRLSLFDKGVIDALKQLSKNDPGQAARVLDKAREARQAMLNIFNAIATGRPDEIKPELLRRFNSYITEALSEHRFRISEGVLKTEWDEPEKKLMQPVWAFCLSAAELLKNEDQTLIKRCGACAWLFLDESKNHRRKWCDMQTCGTNEKARRYYARQKKNAAGSHPIKRSGPAKPA